MTSIAVVNKLDNVLKLVGKQQREYFQRNGYITNRFLTFSLDGIDVLDPFMDELFFNDVNPYEYYGYAFVSSQFLEVVKEFTLERVHLSSYEIANELGKYLTYGDIACL